MSKSEVPSGRRSSVFPDKSTYDRKKYDAEDGNENEDDDEQPFRKKLFHPFSCRLDESAAFETSSRENLTQVAFACWTLGIVTLFRPSFLLLVTIIYRMKAYSSEIEFMKFYALITCCLWFTVVMIVLFPVGLIPLLATYIKKRRVLLIHPWALMLLYFDVVVWCTITTIIYISLRKLSPSVKNTITHIRYPVATFVIIYTDIFVYFILYYIYVTYYIVASVTVIEKFY